MGNRILGILLEFVLTFAILMGCKPGFGIYVFILIIARDLLRTTRIKEDMNNG